MQDEYVPEAPAEKAQEKKKRIATTRAEHKRTEYTHTYTLTRWEWERERHTICVNWMYILHEIVLMCVCARVLCT